MGCASAQTTEQTDATKGSPQTQQQQQIKPAADTHAQNKTEVPQTFVPLVDNTPKQTTEHSMTTNLQLKLSANSVTDSKKREFYGDNQILVCSPTDAMVKISAKGSRIGLVILGPKEFPLKEETEVWEKSEMGSAVSVTVKSRGIEGFTVFVVGEGHAEVDFDGMGKPILSILHIEPLP
ncbi:Conserved_hypothetical protein [Hexamita inflata]|uniref:Lipoprotein n=1 Tax=Hexamita inflata TaxID=28002 RepID=A0ABP1H4R2_9EUKA